MQVVVELALVDELGMVGVDGFEFDGDFQIRPCVYSLENLPKGSLVDLPNYLEVLPHFFRHY